ncbi:MAG TPA: Gfo/Idh/MocA family oxidoreductase [Chthoniobacteraceae bacterium]|jgi:predicted dehydrogenase|nr:Gfo/Idh/MocA family oxidoreductase [Chthoniobacteraceae bacterium]
MVQKSRIGIVGCGNISTIYLENSARFENIEVTAVADLDPARAEAQARAFNISNILTPKELIEGDKVDIVLNLTIPAAHGEVALDALRNGKSVYNEKPLSSRREEAAEMTALARKHGLRVGCAPDTFLASPHQNARKLLDEGAIGAPVAAVAFMLSGGPDSWHPNPWFFYQPGGGPMFDMGPYYLTMLTSLLGPVKRVSGSARISTARRAIAQGPNEGKSIDVQTPSHIAGLLDFVSGPVATIVTSFDIPGKNHLPCIEIYGTGGTMQVPDPNCFDGEVLINRPGEKEWTAVPSPFGYGENARGLGLADMAAAIASRRPHRANEHMAAHVLDIMHAILEASAKGTHMELKTEMTRPEPLPEHLEFGQVPA